MAEFGDILGGAAAPRDFQVDVEMLDYAYVNDCKDWHKLSAILDVLKSGREGYYPDLIRVAEERLVALLPLKEKKRYVSMNRNVTPSEIAEAESDLLQWKRTVAEKEATLKQSQVSSTVRLPPVRGTGAQKLKDAPAALFTGGSSVCAASDDLLTLLSANQRRKFEKLSVELDVSALSDIKRQYRAELEKTKGNESFRVADNQEAVSCYSRALACNPRAAVVWANRAMAYIRLELFDLAEADSSVALLLDPSYVKAYSRRGLVRFKRGKYAQAVQDFRSALALDPDNAELTKLLHTATEKYREVEGVELDGQEAAQGLSRAAEEEERAAPVTVIVAVAMERVAGPEGLLLPAGSLPQWELLGQGHAKRGTSVSDIGAAAPPRFVRVSVVSEEDSSSDEEEGEGERGAGNSAAADADAEETRGADGFNRVAIVEESESDSEDEDGEGLGSQRGASASAEDLKERGNAHLRQNRAEEAVDAYTAALRLDPHFVAALNNRAQAHLVLQNYEAVVADCNAVLLREPGNLKALFRRASARASLGLGKAEHRAQVLQDLSLVLTAEPGHRQAQELLAQASAAAPNAASVLEQQAGRALDVLKLKQQSQQLLGDGLNDKVIALLGPFLRAADEPPFSELLQSDRTTLLHLLATAYASTADYEHAVAVQETILGIDPTNFRALYKRAEGQLQVAARAPAGQARTAALELAERDIAAALEGQGANNTDILALRQKLLRLRNTAPAGPAVQPPPAAGPVTGSRQQSDLQKEQGNAAMAEKHYANALQHYNRAILLDSTNLAAYNNRALAHIKLRDYAAAEADAGVVIGSKGTETDTGAAETLKLKALCRRAQARRAICDTKLSASDPHGAESLLRAAVADLQELLKLDPTNKAALAELKLAREAQRRCDEALAPVTSVGPASAGRSGLPTPAPANKVRSQPPITTSPTGRGASPAAATTPIPPPPAPRADAQRISSLLSPTKAAASPSAFGEMGLVARATKRRTPASAGGRIPTDNADTSGNPPSSPPPAPGAASGAGPASPVQTDRAASGAARSSPATSAPSVVLTSAPFEQPKTVYEFERVWRGLKGRPDLFAQYVCAFKKSTYKKVLKEALSPDLLSFMWRSVREHAPSTNAQLRVLVGFSSAPSFNLALSLLPAEDVACVADMLARAQAAADALPSGTAEQEQARAAALSAVAELRATYRCSL